MEKFDTNSESERKIKFSTLELQGLRSEQQDVIVVRNFRSGDKEACAAVVCDGHGEHGKLAAEYSTQIFLNDIEAVEVNEKWIRDRFAEANKVVSIKAPDSGSTASFALIGGGKILVAYVGDSEVRIAKKNGHLETVTIPHRYKMNSAEAGRLEGAPIYGGAIQMGRGALGVTRSIGDREFEPYVLHVPEILEREIAPDDKYLLLGTDGFWDVAARKQSKRKTIENILADSKNIEEARKAIAEFLSKQKLNDNTNIGIFEL